MSEYESEEDYQNAMQDEAEEYAQGEAERHEHEDAMRRMRREKDEAEIDIYKMKLHEYEKLRGNTFIMRVPGGWIYDFGMQETAVFVPYSEKSGTIRIED